MKKLLMKRTTLEGAIELLKQPNNYLRVLTNVKYDLPLVRIFNNKEGDIAFIITNDYLKLKQCLKLNSVLNNQEIYEWRGER